MISRITENKDVMVSKNILLEVKKLKKYFPIRSGIFSRITGNVHAVDDVSFYISEGENLGLVGESGCGKTTTGRVVLGLQKPTSGEALFYGENIFEYSKARRRAERRNMQIIFQDPYASLNPGMTVEKIIGEPMWFHGIAKGKDNRDRVSELLETVGLSRQHKSRYPHEFSGGQRQRIGIARALSLNPKLIICDEPVSALDVSIQAQVINLLEDLQAKFGFSYLFIAHDLSVIKHISNRVAVMYLGKIVETAETEELFSHPQHPYTEALMSAVPVPDPTLKRERIILKGDVPSPINPPSGCYFRTRCRYVKPICSEQEPLLTNLGGAHYAACHLRC